STMPPTTAISPLSLHDALPISRKGYAFSEDTEMQREFEAAFPYQETDDQLRCIEEIKADMEKQRPMDRLLCGDVGYGKTEVAIRSEEHTSELQSRFDLVCRLLL